LTDVPSWVEIRRRGEHLVEGHRCVLPATS
jgi:hypothetical protein